METEPQTEPVTGGLVMMGKPHRHESELAEPIIGYWKHFNEAESYQRIKMINTRRTPAIKKITAFATFFK